MINRIIAIVYLAFIGIIAAVFYVLAVILWMCTAAFDRRLVWLHMFTSFWACLYLWAMPAWSLSISGREKIRRQATYIIVSNHQSALDILVAFRLFFPFKWVSKVEMFRVPFIGWNMRLNRYIKIVRGKARSRKQMMADCERALANGSSVYLFPEGTRSATGVLKPFKTGAFILAHQMKLPILAIAINGTKDALPKASLNFHGRHQFHIKVIGEIAYDAFANMSVDETAEMVRAHIAEHVDS